MRVAIFMGSATDADVMKMAANVLDEFGVEYEARVVSAHRAPDVLVRRIREAEEAGAQVFIAGAGLAAALPGAVASHTTKPVIGVPLERVEPGISNGLGGLDALLSMAQMPPRVPVATVGIGNARNAAYLALQILALSDMNLSEQLRMMRLALSGDAAQEEPLWQNEETD